MLFLVVDVVTGRTLSWIVLGFSLSLFVLLWAVLPLRRRRSAGD